MHKLYLYPKRIKNLERGALLLLPPPVGQVVKVVVSKALGEFANEIMMDEDRISYLMSSFYPGDNAKLYASPEVVISVDYKSESLSVAKDTVHPRRVGGGSSLRS
ncbi:SH3 and multiple ankyrin repeat domains protein 1 [Nephila pilipes]|uniref:SH3 and multiple ankyrin repeat domains protein 1 n=1 Tax=Nephila pilipes TaxID=299642 RepID=A0A8X6QND1_NEPPI|nr:SH3 and multiple ankyrin repeat domains protein 1 [Nephila pilipes]